MSTVLSPRVLATRGQRGLEIKAVKFNDLSRDEIEAWSALQRVEPAFESPFFRPEYSALVAGVRPDLEVAVLRTEGRCAGFWPFERSTLGVAHPPGLSLCTYEGVVTERELDWSAEELLKGCRLSAWTFNHLLASQAPLERFHWSHAHAAVVDLPQRFEDYREQKRSSGSETISKMLRKRRSLEREVGPVRLVALSDDSRLLDTVIEWKRAQYRRILSIDHLAPGWTRELLRRIARFRNDDFSGMLSALYAGDHLLAAHFGMHSRGLLHGWFPVYNHDFEKYSPGMVFWITLAEQAADLGIRRIDLGKGDERYKQSLKTGDVLLATGAVDRHFLSGAIRKGCWDAQQRILASPMAGPVRRIVHAWRGVRGYGATHHSSVDETAETTVECPLSRIREMAAAAGGDRDFLARSP